MPESREDEALEYEMMLASIDEGDPTDWSLEQREIVRLRGQVVVARQHLRTILGFVGEISSWEQAAFALAKLDELEGLWHSE